MKLNRRRFLASSAALASGAFIPSCSKTEKPGPRLAETSPFKLSLAQWSLHRALQSGDLDNLDWPHYTGDFFQINALEWVNQFFAERTDKLGLQPRGGDYIDQMKKRCDDNGMISLLIMCDGVGQIGDPDEAKRRAAVEGHYAWLDAAKKLGCHSIRVNSASNASLAPEEQAKLCADGLRRLCEHAKPMELNVIVENHGGLSSHGAWLAGVLKSVGMDNCGSLPDFGNFYVAKKRDNAAQFEQAKNLFSGVEGLKEDEFGLAYDRYQGLKDLMPYAKGVSAKSHSFTAEGEEQHTDYAKMLQIAKDSGFTGYVGIEYEGSDLSEEEGILATKNLLLEKLEQL
ncbi:sugar phosphate isomerase/epimerase family protein [Haloferula chungangensis]|uniref:Sugar phosphate isomerase/epimerase family protein n=1 Tax=Haloferula chungangensis TaxID=1048331 RepID=A0ABW2L944_9BACT